VQMGQSVLSIILSDVSISYLMWNRDACIVFKAGKNCDGYFDANDLLAQVNKAIDIFEEQTNGFATGLFLFDNAPSHQKQVPSAISAHKMPKNLNNGWTHHKGGPQM